MSSGRASVIQGYFPPGAARFANTPRNSVRPNPNGFAAQLTPGMVNLARTPGQPLPGDVRQKMEAVFGTSFAQVRIHTGMQAQALGAHAFTHGTDIYFAAGHYNPVTHAGQQLLAHELTHVVQQRTGRVRNPFHAGVAIVHDAALEAEAERMSARMAAVRLPVQPKMPAMTIQRLRERIKGLGNATNMHELAALIEKVKNQFKEFKETEEETHSEAFISSQGYRATSVWSDLNKFVAAKKRAVANATNPLHRTMPVRYESLPVSLAHGAKGGEFGDGVRDVAGFLDNMIEVLNDSYMRNVYVPPAPVAHPNPPSGYRTVTHYRMTVYVDDRLSRLDTVGETHLVQGAVMGIRGSGGYHQSGMISGATSNDFYLHPSKSNPTLYLIEEGTHSDGVKMVRIKKTGRVSGGHHYF